MAADETARFYTRSGVLTAQLVGKRIVLDFPATPATAASAPTGLLAALGVTDATVFSNHVDYLVLLESEAEVRRIQVDFAALKACQVTRGIMVTAVAHGTEYDFVSRFFAPAAGIDEDPVTGSAHCTLAPFWAERLEKPRLQAYQASARGGEVLVEWLGERVLLAGSAVTVFNGTLWV